MADLKLDILVINTYSSKTMGIADISTYPSSPPITSPTIEITIPGFGLASLPFTPNDFNVFNSGTLGITSPGEDIQPLPDGIYTLRYSVTPAYQNYVEKTIIRVEQLQEKFDNAFMKLDMMECDKAIKTQDKVLLTTIYFLIQGSIAAANNCAVDQSTKLYQQASRLLDNFIKRDCGCSGTNYLTNYTRY
jgi:hypothetical protein